MSHWNLLLTYTNKTKGTFDMHSAASWAARLIVLASTTGDAEHSLHALNDAYTNGPFDSNFGKDCSNHIDCIPLVIRQQSCYECAQLVDWSYRWAKGLGSLDSNSVTCSLLRGTKQSSHVSGGVPVSAGCARWTSIVGFADWWVWQPDKMFY